MTSAKPLTSAKPSSLDDWLSYIDTVHPVGWDLGLDRVRAVGETLDVLRPAPLTILVAGTNGKGSTCEYLEAFATAQGLRCGKSTSPHLFHFNERIAINGKPLSDEAIVSAFEAIERARGETTLTYFEFASLASMWLFRQQQVDVAVLEIGLGGRLDAMNIVEPDLTIITSIAMDHEAWLGDSREAIALEKAGIMRPGVPCLVSDRSPPHTLLDRAALLGVPLQLIGQDFDLPEDIAPPQLPADSLAVALAAASQLGWSLDQAGRIAATVELVGRRTWLRDRPAVLLDVAHNPAAAASLAEYLASLDRGGEVHALTGMYRDKDIEAVTGFLAPHVKTWHLTAVEEARAASTDELADRLAVQVPGTTTAYAKIADAVAGVLECASPEDLILVFGSFPVVAGALPHFQETDRT